ncbi:hypothetical protein [Paenibacillus polymyxa]|uniref:hypothetical protein n=1 Tax=Paenibacillus polymyxa TaxID=1406 RepID=UPI002ED292E2
MESLGALSVEGFFVLWVMHHFLGLRSTPPQYEVDWEEYKREQGAKKCLETKKEKYEIYEASYGTATTLAGRALKFKEVRLQ